MRKIVLGLVATAAIAAPVAVANSANASTGPQRQAIGAARDYLSFSGFSKQGLIDQLSSKYGDGYSWPVATYAVNHIRVWWKKQAVGSAHDTSPSHFSCSGLIDQLHSPYDDSTPTARPSTARTTPAPADPVRSCQWCEGATVAPDVSNS